MAIIYGDVVGTTQKAADWDQKKTGEVDNINGKKPTIYKEADGNHTGHNIILDGKIVKGSGKPKDVDDLVPKSYVDARYSVFTFNQDIPTSAWADYVAAGTAEKNLFNAGYVKRAKLTVPGVEDSMIPYLTPDETTIESAGAEIAPRAQCISGGVYIYARAVPIGAVTVLTAECRKVVR